MESKDIIKYFEDEIIYPDDIHIAENKSVFNNPYYIGLLQYKLAIQDCDLRYEEIPLTIIQKPDWKPRQRLKNAIIINNTPYMEKIFLDKECTLAMKFCANIPQNKNTAVYIDSENRVTHIVTSRSESSSVVAAVCQLLPRIMPWYFRDVPKDIRNNIIHYWQEYQNGKCSVAEVTLNPILHTLLVQRGVIQQIQFEKLKLIENKIIDEKIEVLRNQLSNYQSEIHALQNKITYYINEIRETNVMILGYKQNPEDKNIQDLIDFIQSTPEDIEIDVDSHNISFHIKTTLDQVDLDDAQTIIEHPQSYLVKLVEQTFDISNQYEKYIRKLLQDIFINREIECWCETLVVVNLNDSHVYSSTVTNAEINYMQHPHLNSTINCFGTALNMIQSYLIKNRYAEALAQILYAAKQFSMGDTVAGGFFVNGLQKKCLKGSDGVFRDAKEMIEKMIKEEQ